MSEHDDKRPRNDRKPRVDDEPSPDDLAGDASAADALQGEGDYQASRRYREQVTEFIATADVDALARKAAPEGAQQARELALAEASGRDRSKGDDAADPGLMYPKRESDAER